MAIPYSPETSSFPTSEDAWGPNATFTGQNTTAGTKNNWLNEDAAIAAGYSGDVADIDASKINKIESALLNIEHYILTTMDVERAANTTRSTANEDALTTMFYDGSDFVKDTTGVIKPNSGTGISFLMSMWIAHVDYDAWHTVGGAGDDLTIYFNSDKSPYFDSAFTPIVLYVRGDTDSDWPPTTNTDNDVVREVTTSYVKIHVDALDADSNRYIDICVIGKKL